MKKAKYFEVEISVKNWGGTITHSYMVSDKTLLGAGNKALRASIAQQDFTAESKPFVRSIAYRGIIYL